MDNSVIASSLKPFEHFAIFEEMILHFFEEIDLTKLLVYLYDTAPVEYLDYLAEQMDMLGYNGWILADTEQKKRDLLKRATSIKQTLGTPYAIKQAAEALGIKGEIIINESLSFQYDGEFQYDGTMQYGAGTWAIFTVMFSGSQNPGITEEKLSDFEKMIEQLKPARSKLLGLTLY